MHTKKLRTIDIILLVFGFSLVFLCSSESKRIQEFSLYSKTENIETYSKNVRNLNNVSLIVKNLSLQSVCSQKGVWAFFTGKDFTTVHSYGYHPATSNWTCSSRRIMADFMSPFQSIRHLGNSDLDKTSLSLYAEPFFAAEELYINGEDLSLPSPQRFSSFGFTGRDSWTLYSDPDWQGESVCLLCKCDREGLDVGVTYTAKLSLSTSSLRKGCHGSLLLLPNGHLTNKSSSDSKSAYQLNDSPTLRLHNSSNHQDGSLRFSGTQLRLPCKYMFDTFSTSKQSNWTLYTGLDFDGKSTCLVFPKNHEQGYENSMQFPDPITVSSIHFGCKQNLERDRVIVFETPFNKTSIATEPSTRRTTTPRPRNTIPGIGESEDLEGFAPPPPPTTTKPPETTPKSIPSPTLEITTTPGIFPSPTLEITTATGILDTTTSISEFFTERVTVLPTLEEILSTARVNINLLQEPSSSRQGKKLPESPSGVDNTLTNGETGQKLPMENEYEDNENTAPPFELTTEEPILYYITTEADVLNNQAASSANDNDDGENKIVTGGNIFFISFLVVLGLLTLAMICAIIGFIYLRGKNSGAGDLEVPRSA